MSEEYFTRTHKHQKHPQVHFQQYLYNAGEPNEDNSFHISVELEAELLENSLFMKRRIRRIAQRARNQYRFS